MLQYFQSAFPQCHRNQVSSFAVWATHNSQGLKSMSLGVVCVYMCINKNISIHFFLQNNCERDKVKQQILCAADSTDSFHSVQDFFEQSRMKINKVNEKVTSGRKPKKKTTLIFKISGTQTWWPSLFKVC